jgi:hypothetical protein
MRPQARQSSLDFLLKMEEALDRPKIKNEKIHNDNVSEETDRLNDLIKNNAIVIAHHLIDGQVVIYHAPYFSLKHAFVVKLPSQKRKVIQYLESLQKKDLYSFKTYWKNYNGQEMIDRLEHYLDFIKHNHKQEYLVLDHKELGQNSEAIANKIVKFSDHNRSKHRFPLHHL